MERDFFNLNYTKSAMQINEQEKKINTIKSIVTVIIIFICGIIYITRPEEKKIEMHIKDNISSKLNIEENLSKQIDSSNVIEETSIKGQDNIEVIDMISESYDAKSDIGNNKKIEIEKPKNAYQVNINTASSEELEKIDGIGPSIAKNIIEYRNKKGGFAHKGEIKNVKRVGAKLYDKIKDYITVD